MIRFLQKSGQTTKYVLGGLLLIICASMVITLIPGGLGGEVFGGAPGRGIVAKVGGDDITADDVRLTARQMLQQQLPQGGAHTALLPPFLSQAAGVGLRCPAAEVGGELQRGRHAATFFPGGSFIGQQEYEDLLQRYNLTTTKFEESVGHDILLTKLQALIASSAGVSETQIHEE